MNVLCGRIAEAFSSSVYCTIELQELRKQHGEKMYFEVLGSNSQLQGAFAQWILHAKYFTPKGRRKYPQKFEEKNGRTK